jgi:thiol-disulfide isomerase/thioredoxin
VKWYLLVVAGCASAPPPVVSHEVAADAKLYDPGAPAPYALAERYHGKVVVLDFWAGWCAECRRTVPQVARLADAFEQDGLVVIGVNAGERPEDVATYARELGITYPIALDPEHAFADRLAATDLPVVLVIDPGGVVVHRSRHIDVDTLAVIRQLLHAPNAEHRRATPPQAETPRNSP